MDKFRKAYFEVEKALGTGVYRIVILLGMRKTGKTTILKQLAQRENSHYHDFKTKALSREKAEDLIEMNYSYLLLDEVGYMEDYDLFLQVLPELLQGRKTKVVFTSSAYGAMKQIGIEHLGGGRSWKVEVFPLSFEEYLHFSRDDFSYGDDYRPTREDIFDFYRMKNLPHGMDFIIDEMFLLETFSEKEVARANRYGDERDSFIQAYHLRAVLDIFAYTLMDHLSDKRLKGSRYGNNEFSSTKGLSLSKTLFGLSEKEIVKLFSTKDDEEVTIRDVVLTFAYLCHSGYLYLDRKVGGGEQDAHVAFNELVTIRSRDALFSFLKEYNYCVISPLLYTRLMINFEMVAEKEIDNPALFGRLFETAVKSETVLNKGYKIYHESAKYQEENVEVDLFEKGILLEAAVGNKKKSEFAVDKILLHRELVRILTCDTGKKTAIERKENYYRIEYPTALLMASQSKLASLFASS